MGFEKAHSIISNKIDQAIKKLIFNNIGQGVFNHEFNPDEQSSNISLY